MPSHPDRHPLARPLARPFACSPSRSHLARSPAPRSPPRSLARRFKGRVSYAGSPEDSPRPFKTHEFVHITNLLECRNP